MKFTCERCSTRYSINDEKVQGKVLKIRCKTCGNIIVVREQGASSAQPAAGAAPAAGQAAPRTELDVGAPKPSALSAAAVEWFVAIKGRQHGPMRHADVVNLYRQGKITARSNCWNEGLSGWTSLRELPEFKNILGGAHPAPAAPPPPPPTQETETPSPITSLPAAAARPGTDPAAQAQADPFAAVGGVEPAGGAPRESTRVFIMNAGLANRSQKHRVYAAVAAVFVVVTFGSMYADLKGYIEIPLLHSAVDKLAEIGIVEESSSRKLNRSKGLIAEAMKEDEIMKQVCQLNPQANDCIEWKVRKIQARKRGGTRKSKDGKSGTSGALDGLDLDGMFGTGGTGGAGTGVGGAALSMEDFNKLSGSDSDQAAKIRAMLKRGGKSPSKGPKGPKTPNVKSTTGDGAVDFPIEPKVISKTFNNGKNAVEACVTQALKRGEKTPKPAKQKVLVTIGPRGRVVTARFLNSLVNTSKLGNCINKVAKKMRFPPFAGPAFDVEWKLVLSGG
ncbi:MAG: DUF4339 domain-containing protein [Deltaproteobacteria bacterium]|nr:DUF4339 domain-containing protein [Deltaproteobacteria bacterium]